MARLALAVAVILTLASSVANAQSLGAQAPGARAFPAACRPDFALCESNYGR